MLGKERDCISPLNIMYAIRDQQGCNDHYKLVHQVMIAFPIVIKNSHLLHVGAAHNYCWPLSCFCLQFLIGWENWIRDFYGFFCM